MSLTKIEKHKDKYYKLSTKGDTKGQIVDTSFKPPVVVTNAHTASVKSNISKSDAARRNSNRRWLARTLTGSETPIRDSKYTSKLSYINRLEGKLNPVDRVRRFLSKDTAEGGKEFDFHRANEIKEQKLNADILKIGTSYDDYKDTSIGTGTWVNGKFIPSSKKNDFSTGTGVPKEEVVTEEDPAKGSTEIITTGESKDNTIQTKPNVEVKEKNVKSELAIDKPKKYNKDLLKAGFTTDQLDDLRIQHDSWKAARAAGTLGDWEATHFPDRTPRYKNKKKKNKNKKKP